MANQYLSKVKTCENCVQITTGFARTSALCGIGRAAVYIYPAALLAQDSGGEYRDSTVRDNKLASFSCSSLSNGSFTDTRMSTSGCKQI